MHAVTNESRLMQNADATSAYRGIHERAVIDAAFLWLLRSLAVNRPHYTLTDLAELEQRLNAQLDVLMTPPDIGWEACEAALGARQPGEAFAATVIAMRTRDVKRIQIAIDSSLATPAMLPGVVSALGWLTAPIAGPWIERLVRGKDMNHKYLGIAACSVRREDPGAALNDILSRDDCRQHMPLYARALRLVGELRRLDLMPVLQANLASSNPERAFWANWSSILLGDRASANNLKPFVLKPGSHQKRAIDIVFRVLPVEQGREWISATTKDPQNIRAIIHATGVLGDPHAVNWLITKMSATPLARLAAEAFTFITGVDLEKHGLTTPPPADAAPIPNDDPNDDTVGLDEDENLPWPDVDKIQHLWRTHGRHFLVGRRYFLGKAATPDWLKQKLIDGTQRQRHAAALELALVDTQARLINTRAKVNP